MDVFGATIFGEMSELAASTDSINLGQGFPDEDGPAELLAAAQAAIAAGRGNQYPPSRGVGELRRAIASHQRDFYGLDVDPDDGVLVTVGATEAIAAAVLGLTQPGDGMLTFEPYYDSYAACAVLAGAHRAVVTLRPQDGRWTFDPDELRAAVTSRTRLVLLNSPHNPTGKVFTAPELRLIAELAVEHDLTVVTDEVYEHLVFDGEHIPIATLPGMAGRTVTISSAGKTFSVTGWKVGWASGPAELIRRIAGVKQFLTYVGSGPFQYAVADGLATVGEHAARLTAQLRAKRDLLVTGLAASGFEVLSPQATYFATVDLGHGAEAWCRALPATAGVAGIPTRVFYDSHVDRYVRLAFCKRADVIEEAVRRLSGTVAPAARAGLGAPS